MREITVFGAGSWGIALAKLASENGLQVMLWEFDPAAALQLDKTREDKKRLPGIFLPTNVKVTHSLEQAISHSRTALMVVPSKFLRNTAKMIANISGSEKVRYIIAAKGIENGSLCRMSEVMIQEIKGLTADQICAFSGPSHAEEVGRAMPTTLVAASANMLFAAEIQESLSNNYFRVYTNSDMMGVELAGSLKNVIAVAAGISDGLGYGDNAKGALLTRGIVEIARLGTALGAQYATFLGLAGIGDLITTCISKHSRNRYVGEEIGKGRKLEDILNGMVMVAEGVETARAAFALSEKYGIDMPITRQVYQTLFQGKNPGEAVHELMRRMYKSEEG